MSEKELEKKYKEFLNETYLELLLRSPDDVGLMSYLSLLKSGENTMDEIRKKIAESDEAKSIRNFSHYSDKYWNELELVEQYINQNATGDKNTTWMIDVLTRFKEHLPFQKVLIVGCGNGWLERKLYDLGIGVSFDAFDLSEKYLETAKREKGDRMIDYFVSDINNMENISDSKYDAVFNFAILHHCEKIDYATKKLASALKLDGLMFNWEYVGPARNQYTDEHVKIMEEVMSQIPKRFHTKYPLRPSIENFRVEPSEAIHSDLVIPTFRKYFDIIYERELNGGIAYQILWNNTDLFLDKSDKEAQQVLSAILKEDERLSYEKKVPNLFWYCVGKPKQIENNF